MITAEKAPLTTPPENRGLVWIGSEELSRGFAGCNEALGVPSETQAEVDLLLWKLGEVDARTVDHCRRVGGYAGAIVKKIGGPQYGDAFHEGLARVCLAVHDVGKLFTDPATLHRTWGDDGWGKWDDAVDMLAMRDHPADGYKILDNNPALPPEAKFVAGCHHRYPDPSKPEREPYGIELSEIDKEYAADPAMRDWVHFLVKISVAADVYDSATNRKNSYLQEEEGLYDYLVGRLQPLFPEQWSEVMKALQEEHLYYHLRAPQATGYAPQQAV